MPESLVTVIECAGFLMAVLIIASRVIPDEYDPAPARRPTEPPVA